MAPEREVHQIWTKGGKHYCVGKGYVREIRLKRIIFMEETEGEWVFQVEIDARKGDSDPYYIRVPYHAVDQWMEGGI